MATIADLPQMWVGTSANYEALETKVAGAIYFLTDTRQIARGNVKFSQEAQLVSALPGSGSFSRQASVPHPPSDGSRRAAPG